MRLVVLLPAFNEAGSICTVLGSIPKTLSEDVQVLPIVIDDGSTDRTAAIARQCGVTVVSHAERSGLAEAFRTGLRAALLAQADLIATLDADGQYRGEELALLLARMRETGADLVVGDRQIRRLTHMPWKHKFGNVIGSAMLRLLRCTGVSDASSGFRLFTARFGRALAIRSLHTYTHEMLIQAKAHGFSVAEVPVTFLSRPHGKSKLVRTLRHHILRSCGTIVRAYFSPLPTEAVRVLFVTRSLQAGAGGMQLYARTLLGALRGRPEIRLSLVGYGGGRIGLLFFLPFAYFRILCTRSTFVHVGDALSALALPLLKFLRPDLRFSVTVYGLDLVYPNSFYQFLLRHALRQADRIVAISHATAEKAKRLGVSPDRILVLPCALFLSSPALILDPSPAIWRRKLCCNENEGPLLSGTPERRTGGEGFPHLLLLGRQIKRKGTVWFLENVLESLLQALPDVRVTIAGDGPELPNIHAAIHRLHLQPSVSVLGSVSDERKQRLFAEATLFLMPNIPVPGDMEGFGLTCIEAAASGVPVVAARLEGIQDTVIEGKTGLFFEARNAKDCDRIIREALAKKWHAAAMRELCRQRFSADSLASSYLEYVWH